MIPGMDLASHAAHERTNAFYDRVEGKYRLYLMKDKALRQRDEVCITYGDEKGACESTCSQFVQPRAAVYLPSTQLTL